jgi:parallel beta-helix repeat protein
VTFAAGLPVAGTPANTASLDGSYLEISNLFGITTPSVRTMFSTDINAGSDVPWGGVFSNPTGAAMTVTSVDITGSVDTFRAVTTTIVPATGWTRVDARTIRWTGSVTVDAHSGSQFLTKANTPSAAFSTSVTMTVFTSAGTFASPAFAVNVRNVATKKAADASVAFAGTVNYVSFPTPNALFSVQVTEERGDGTGSAIAVGTLLTVTIPAGWSNVTTTIASPFELVAVTEATPYADGQVQVRTIVPISGTTTPLTSLLVQATLPTSSSPNLFPVTLSLSGSSNDGWPIASVNQAVVRVAASGTDAVIAEFRSATIGPGPVRQIDFRTDFNIADGSGSDAVRVEVFNNLTGMWEVISTVVPTASNVTVTRTFGADFEPYVDASNRMRMRFVSPGLATRRLRIDFVQWVMTLGYTVDNRVGLDVNNGNVAHPWATLSKAASSISSGNAVYVEVGNSQSGTSYEHDVSITTSGTATCSTLFQGVPNPSGQLPLIRAVMPGVDSGILVGANYVTVDRFEIDGGQVGLYSDVGKTGVILSNSIIHVPDFSFGVLLQTNTSSAAVGNRIDATGPNASNGVWDFTGTSNRVDGNVISGFRGSDGLFTMFSGSPVIQRNIVSGGRGGIHVAHCTGSVKLYNNTVDSNSFLGVYSEDTGGTVTSRNNIITNNANGWAWDSIGTIDSNYDDVWNNVSNYTYHGTVAPGPNSISANPNFIQTTNPALSTYYRPAEGSPCIDAGTNVGLPVGGTAPDIGAVEQ